MGNNMEDISEDIKEELKSIAEKSGMKQKILESEFEKLYEELENDEGFKDEDGDTLTKELLDYIILRLKGAYEFRQPVNSYDVIPVGMDQIGEDRNGIRRTSIYAIDREKKLRRISFAGDVCDEIADIQLLYKYSDVPLVEMSKSGDLMADERTVFGEMEETPLVNDPTKVIKLTGAKKIVLNDIYSSSERTLAKKILSETNKDGWSIKTDWRAILGVVTKVRHGSEEDKGTNWASLTVIDKTIPNEEIVNEQGDVVQPGIRCYCSPFVLNDLPNNSRAWVLGPISKSKKSGNVTMNAYCIIPVWEAPI